MAEFLKILDTNAGFDIYKLLLASIFGLFSGLLIYRLGSGNARKRSAFDAIRYLIDVKDEVRFVLEDLSKIPFEDWIEPQKARASDVCTRMHFMGALVANRVIDRELICRTWYYSIPQTYFVLLPLIKHMRKTRHPNYWARFDWLVAETERRNRRHYGYKIPKDMNETLDKIKAQFGKGDE